MLGKLMDTSNKKTHPETNWLTEKEVAEMLNIMSATLQN